MLMDLFSFGVGAFFGTIIGIGIMAMMITSKQADEQGYRIVCPTCYKDSDHCPGHSEKTPNPYCTVENCNDLCPRRKECEDILGDQS